MILGCKWENSLCIHEENKFVYISNDDVCEKLTKEMCLDAQPCCKLNSQDVCEKTDWKDENVKNYYNVESGTSLCYISIYDSFYSPICKGLSTSNTECANVEGCAEFTKSNGDKICYQESFELKVKDAFPLANLNEEECNNFSGCAGWSSAC